MKSNRKHIALLLLGAFIWGVAFVAQSVGAESVGACTFLFCRCVLGVAVLVPFIRWRDKKAAQSALPGQKPQTPAQKKLLAVGGVLCGTALFFASVAQQVGIATTTTAKAGFLTALYIVLVPIVSIFLGKRPPAQIWLCVVVSLVGMYLLCIHGGVLKLGGGDLTVLLSALLFTIQILLLDHYAPQVDTVRLAALEFAVEGLWALVGMLLLEQPSWAGIQQAGVAILYAGIMSSGVAYTIQAVAQNDVAPTVASLAMSLESVFSALAGWVILGQALTPRELLGCALMFGSIVLAQIPLPARRGAVKAEKT